MATDDKDQQGSEGQVAHVAVLVPGRRPVRGRAVRFVHGIGDVVIFDPVAGQLDLDVGPSLLLRLQGEPTVTLTVELGERETERQRESEYVVKAKL